MSSKLFSLTVIIFLAISFIMFLFIDSLHGNLNEATGLVVGSESFPTYLETSPIIASMPKSSSIGIKIGEQNYEIEGRDITNVESLNKENDVVVTLPEGYETVIGELGLCGAVRKAYSEDLIKVETFASKTKLLFKYAKLIKYSDCLK